jgi:tetratricopeptide (TPR) repeat protein
MDADLTKRFKELNNKCTFFTLGKILHELGEYKNAIIFYERMLDLTSELPEKKIRADIHFHIAISAFEDGSFTQALDHLKKAERLINELLQFSDEESVAFLPVLATDVPLSLIRILMNKGLIYQKKKDYKNAEISFHEALKKHGTKNEEAWVHFHLGVLHFCQRNYEKAHNNYCQALKWAEDPLLKTEINQRLKILDQMSSTS